MIDTLSALDGIQVPGDIRKLSYQWAEEDSWKDTVMRPSQSPETEPHERHDDRRSRSSEPYYHYPADERAALAAWSDGGCKGCVFLEQAK